MATVSLCMTKTDEPEYRIILSYTFSQAIKVPVSFLCVGLKGDTQQYIHVERLRLYLVDEEASNALSQYQLFVV